MNKQDNPVPSIDYVKLAKQFVVDNNMNRSIIRTAYLYRFAEFLNKQNGVETNKVQPVQTKCICDENICKCSFF